MAVLEMEKAVALKLKLRNEVTEKEKTMTIRDLNIELSDDDLCELARGVEEVQEKKLMRIDKVVTTRLLELPEGPEI